jgi:hypothetical protein
MEYGLARVALEVGERPDEFGFELGPFAGQPRHLIVNAAFRLLQRSGGSLVLLLTVSLVTLLMRSYNPQSASTWVWAQDCRFRGTTLHAWSTNVAIGLARSIKVAGETFTAVNSFSTLEPVPRPKTLGWDQRRFGCATRRFEL